MQLCINFTNERLQQRFNAHTFTQELDVYRAEGVPFEPIAFVDNAPVLALLSSKPRGLLNLLDEEVRIPQGSDLKWLAKCADAHATHPAFGGPKVTQRASAFLVRHYAGQVTYEVTAMVEKNADRLSRNLSDLLSSSADARTKALFPQQADAQDRRGSAGRMASTVGEKFRSQLTRLMTTVEKTRPFFIRCVKPNQAKSPRTLEMKMVVEQLTHAGVFEAVKIRQTGFPFRRPHADFYRDYLWITHRNGARTPAAPPGTTDAERCAALLRAVPQDFSHVHIGKTFVLYRADEHRILELLRNLALGEVFQRFQAAFRRRMGRVYRQLLRKAITGLEGALRAVRAASTLGPAALNQLDAAVAAYHETLGRFGAIFAEYKPRAYEEVVRLKRCMALRLEVDAEARTLLAAGGKPNLVALVALVAKYAEVTEVAPTAAQAEVEASVRALHERTVLRIDKLAAEALRLLDREAMLSVCTEADSYGYATAALLEIAETLTLADEDFVKMQLNRAVQMKDPARVISREIALRKLYLAEHASSFQLARCPLLVGPTEWASAKWGGSKSALADGMLSFTSTPIHRPLTQIDDTDKSSKEHKELTKQALLQFKSLLGFLGERKLPYPEEAGAEWLRVGMDSRALHCEMYVQLMKQLTANPSEASNDKGWQLLVATLSYFPPPKPLENYVAFFIKRVSGSSEGWYERLELLLNTSIYRASDPDWRPADGSFSVKAAMERFAHMTLGGAYAGHDTVAVGEAFDAVLPQLSRASRAESVSQHHHANQGSAHLHSISAAPVPAPAPAPGPGPGPVPVPVPVLAPVPPSQLPLPPQPPMQVPPPSQPPPPRQPPMQVPPPSQPPPPRQRPMQVPPPSSQRAASSMPERQALTSPPARTASVVAEKGDSNLLPGWKSATTPDGRTYYYNAGRQETRWERPVKPAGRESDEETPPPPPEGFSVSVP